MGTTSHLGEALINRDQRAAIEQELGELEKAAADFQKAADLDPSNEDAKSKLKVVSDELKLRAAAKKPEPAPVEAPVKAPESIDLGNLSEANAVRMVKPIYPALAKRSNVEGRVAVAVVLDEEGNVVSTKVVSGHQFFRGAAEDAARRSKFKPAMFASKPIKATGVIMYNFTRTN